MSPESRAMWQALARGLPSMRSMTKRPNTEIDRSSLIARALLKTNARINVGKHPIAQRILADKVEREQRETFCCDVVGVFE